MVYGHGEKKKQFVLEIIAEAVVCWPDAHFRIKTFISPAARSVTWWPFKVEPLSKIFQSLDAVALPKVLFIAWN